MKTKHHETDSSQSMNILLQSVVRNNPGQLQMGLYILITKENI